MITKKFQGVVVPMITPLTKELKIDILAVNKLMAVFAENNISPLILGTTGESSSIPREEAEVFMKTAVNARQNNQTIYAGVVENNVNEAISRAKQYAALGADVVVATLPSYYALSAKQMENFYSMLAEETPCPIMMYNIKATTHMSISLEVIEKMSKHRNIVGLKDSERDLDRMDKCIHMFRQNPEFSFFCGCAAFALDAMQLGADGIVPSTGNVAPEMYKKFYDAIQQKDYTLALKMQEATDRVAEVYQKGFTLGESLAILKILAERRGFCQRWMMPPLTEFNPNDIPEIQINI